MRSILESLNSASVLQGCWQPQTLGLCILRLYPAMQSSFPASHSLPSGHLLSQGLGLDELCKAHVASQT